jgi:putative colanic acid biosynthesis acetyltransferase WcaF
MVRWSRVASIRLKNAGGLRLVVGKQFTVGRRCDILSPGEFVAGDYVSIGQDFLCETDAHIGSHVLISSRVSFIGNDHDIEQPGVNVYEARRLPPTKVTLEGDNLIGNSVIIVGQVTVGAGTIVGAGSLVTADLPAGWICYGRPAKPMRRRRPDA